MLCTDPARLHELPVEQAMFERALTALPERRRMVIDRLFGTSGCEKITPKELAKILGVTDSRVIQLKQETLQMLNEILVHKLDYHGNHNTEGCSAKCCEPKKTKRKPLYNLED
jgi:DNA-directed RNA polymerase sigma subunit (sigma70/sigma32)